MRKKVDALLAAFVVLDVLPNIVCSDCQDDGIAGVLEEPDQNPSKIISMRRCGITLKSIT